MPPKRSGGWRPLINTGLTGDSKDNGERVRQAARQLARIAARSADQKGARDVVILEVGDVLVLPDEFVVTAGANDRQVKAIVDEVERGVADAGLGRPVRVEGLQDRQWVVLDYGDVIVHVFLQEMRDYYELERLWGDVTRVSWETERARVPAPEFSTRG